MTIKKIAAWDLGATKCAAALVEYHEETKHFHCHPAHHIKIKSCDSLDTLAQQIEQQLGVKMSDMDAICVGAAGQYDGEILHLENGYPYPMNFALLAKKNAWPRFAIIHDYSPIVCGTFTPAFAASMKSDNMIRLNQAPFHPIGRRVALGIGTGVGLKDGVFFANGDFWLGTNEIGHIGITNPPLADNIYQERHRELQHFLRSEHIIAKDEPLTFEKLLANHGIARIHAFFHPHEKNKTAEEIGDLVRKGLANETLSTFAWYVGVLVGNVQLAFMPECGIWLTGGVLLNHLNLFEQPDFFAGIHASPAYLNLRQQFPLGVLCNAEHGFIGSAYYATKRLLNN